ncbi:mechanosensitive ion channel domain-containing protein [Stenotrophomonas sp. SY1]|uniref:mechanosensitive ion channel family protein n=1 Tax=Stenotrophomonas sp. SY1 TaxID=477235 RepID=UPI001E52C975|nr:mechanosensitive ion channel family protein [Stenotrophomonas sp. SY1]
MKQPWSLIVPGLVLAFLISACFQSSHAQEPAASESATLRYANRNIASFHEPLSGAVPHVRAERATAVLRTLDDADKLQPVSTRAFQYMDRPAVAVQVGSHVIFALLPGDTEAEGRPLEQEAARVRGNLQQAFEAERQQRRPQILLRGVLIALAATVVALILAWLIRAGTRRLEHWLQLRIERTKPRSRLRWRDYVRPLVTRLFIVLAWLAQLLVVYVWLAAVLAAFPLTRPLSAGLQVFFADKLRQLARGLVEASPGIVTVLLILFLTRAVAEGVRLFFDNVQRRSIRAPFIHPETASATKRLITIAVWAMGVAIAYPYIPGSSSDAFKGVSVMLGIVFTLGSAGVVNQLMSGMVVVYSRALRRGDMVEIDGIEARVMEVGSLATKLVNLNRQEITLPNSLLVGNAVRNYSKLADDGAPIYLSVKVTIGYDAPWRLVHQILLEAVAATDDLSTTPTPFVLQQALGDFYVEYEVFAALEDAIERLPRKPMIMSTLHANIQDAFNNHGVQIMSPHFEAQPEEAVVVPPSKWFPAGAVDETPKDEPRQ